MAVLERWDRKNQAAADLDNERRSWDDIEHAVRLSLAASFVLTIVVAIVINDLGLIVIALFMLPASYLMARSLRNSNAAVAIRQPPQSQVSE